MVSTLSVGSHDCMITWNKTFWTGGVEYIHSSSYTSSTGILQERGKTEAEFAISWRKNVSNWEISDEICVLYCYFSFSIGEVTPQMSLPGEVIFDLKCAQWLKQCFTANLPYDQKNSLSFIEDAEEAVGITVRSLLWLQAQLSRCPTQCHSYSKVTCACEIS